ncbi:MAG: phage tail tip lysozyme [Anaerosacchariphilus sp.]
MMCVLMDGKENMMATINIEAEKKAYKKFIAAGMTPAGACGLLGNLEAESDGFYPNRVEYLCIKRLKENGKSYTDEKLYRRS